MAHTVAVEKLNVRLQRIRDWEDAILIYIERTELTVVSLLVRYTVCIPLTPVLYFLTTVIIEVYSQCFTEAVSLRDIGKSTSRAERSSPSSLYFKAVKGAHVGSALILWCSLELDLVVSSCGLQFQPGEGEYLSGSAVITGGKYG